MGRIIAMVLRIFNYIFEQDAQRRIQMRREFERQQDQRPPEKSQAQSIADKLEAWLGEQMKAEELMLKRLEATRRRKEEYRRAQAEQMAAEQSHYPEHDTVRDHIETVRRLPRQLDSQVANYMGAASHGKAKRSRKQRFELPGDSALEKLIYAQTILGPCKAHKTMNFKRR